LNFALGFAAALIRGNPTLLPPNQVPAVLSEIAAGFGPVCCLADHGTPALGDAHLDLSRWPAAAPTAANPMVAGDQVAAIAFTSGTTGRPRPHGRSWASYVQGAAALRARVPVQPGATLVGTVPPQHMWGLEASVMLAFQSGCAIQSGTPLLPAEICALLERSAGECWLVTTPVHLRALVLSAIPLPRVAGVLSATAPLDTAIARALEAKTGATVCEIYGTTETGALATRTTANTSRYRFLDGVSAAFADDRAQVSGGHVHEPVFLSDRLVRVEGACFDLEGRISDMVKIGGKRASLSALNLELAAIPGVLDGVFHAPEHPSHNARLKAFVVAPALTRNDILAGLRKRIDPVFLPRPLIKVDHLPRNAAGKLTRDSMAALAAQARDSGRP
jgi:acyl-coenzyme A synthetase/AMP-(fatty) acid ligase